MSKRGADTLPDPVKRGTATSRYEKTHKTTPTKDLTKEGAIPKLDLSACLECKVEAPSAPKCAVSRGGKKVFFDDSGSVAAQEEAPAPAQEEAPVIELATQSELPENLSFNSLGEENSSPALDFLIEALGDCELGLGGVI